MASPKPDQCAATSLDGHAHSGELHEYVGICVNKHERRDWICTACVPLRDGPSVVACGGCLADGTGRIPKVLLPAALADAAPPP